MEAHERSRPLASHLAGRWHGLVIAGAVPLLYDGEWNLQVSLGLVVALWIVLPMLRGLLDKTRRGPSRMAALRKLSLAYWGMLLAHLAWP